MRTALLTALAVAVGTVAFAQDNTTQPQAAGSPDAAFMQKAAAGGMAEVELGKLAADHAQRDEVKKFGQRMVDDHSRAGDELKSLAEKKGVALATGLDPKERALETKLASLHGSAFDQAFMKVMVDDHADAVMEFRRESEGGKDVDVANWALKTLPTLEDHLKHAQSASSTVHATHAATK